MLVEGILESSKIEEVGDQFKDQSGDEDDLGWCGSSKKKRS